MEAKQRELVASVEKEVGRLTDQLAATKSELAAAQKAAVVQKERMDTAVWAASHATGECKMKDMERRVR